MSRTGRANNNQGGTRHWKSLGTGRVRYCTTEVRVVSLQYFIEVPGTSYK